LEHYVTLFDGMFLPQGLALHRSLQRHAGIHTLWVLCVDETAYNVLNRLQLPDVRLISLDTAETQALRNVKAQRSRAEYCWTLTPHAPRFVFERDLSVQRVTYVDADFWLRKSPRAIFTELEESGKSVLITDHGYAADYDQTATSGQFCVQLITFCRGRGEEVLNWWADRCIEWCFARFEDGKFGDQKYLDDWPERFADQVHVLRRIELILTPWNAVRFPYGPAVAFHFHNLRLLDRGQVMLVRGYDIPRATQIAVYGAYLHDLAVALQMLAKVEHRAPAQASKPGWLVRAGIVLKKLRKLLARWNPVLIERLPTPGADK
jgi:hypothetical protein